MPNVDLLRRQVRAMPFSQRQAPDEGLPVDGRGRRNLSPAADAAHCHGGQVRPDAVEWGACKCSLDKSTAFAHGTVSVRPKSKTATSHPKTKTGLPPATTAATRPPSPARSDYSRRIASYQRAAGNAGRPVRNGHRQALHLGSERQEGSAQGDRIDGHDPQCRRAGSQAVPAEGQHLPATRPGCAGQFLLASAGAERRSILAVATWASVPLVGV